MNGNIPINDTLLYLGPDIFAQPLTPTKHIPKNDLGAFEEVILEPISTDQKLKQQLRGYYRVKIGYVENSMGNRFFFDTYSFQWLAFEK